MNAVWTNATALAYYEHLNHGNTTALLELFHPDASFEHPHAVQTLRGRGQILDFFEEQQRRFRRIQITPTGTFTGYPEWAVTWRMQVETHDGVQLHQNGVDVFVGRNHAIECVRVFCDPTGFPLPARAMPSIGGDGSVAKALLSNSVRREAT